MGVCLRPADHCSFIAALKQLDIAVYALFLMHNDLHSMCSSLNVTVAGVARCKPRPLLYCQDLLPMRP